MEGKKMDVITVTLNPCVDRTLRDGLLIDEQSGGKGLNVARVLSSLGIASAAVAPVGGEVGKLFQALAASEGIDLRAVPVSGEVRVIDTEVCAGDVRVTRGAGFILSEVECALLLDAVKQLLPGAKCLAICGSAPGEAACRLIPNILSAAREAGVRTLVDVNGEALTRLLPADIDLLKMNADELSHLTGAPDDPFLAEGAARDLTLRGAKTVLVTLGARGSFFVAGDRTFFCPPVKVDLVNCVGSGDCYTAYFIYAELKGYEQEMALAIASAAGAANARVFPAARIERRDVEALIGYEI